MADTKKSEVTSTFFSRTMDAMKGLDVWGWLQVILIVGLFATAAVLNH